MAHDGSLGGAHAFIDAVSGAGADAIKFQTYKANTIASKHSPSYWYLKQEKTRKPPRGSEAPRGSELG